MATKEQELGQIACNINQSLRSYFCPTMEIGAIVDHPDGYKVKIIDGCYLDPTYGRVSNWWTWKQVKQDGSLGKKASGYGW